MKLEIVNEELRLELSAAGEPGRAATVAVDSVETLEAGQPAYVENAGTKYDARLKFGLPSGSAAVWGKISGNLSEQSDLKAALARKGTAILNSASGSPAVISDGAEGVPLEGLSVDFSPQQSGSGDPSPVNKRNFAGFSSCTVLHEGASAGDAEVLAVHWETEAGTVYGGTLDVTAGLLSVTWAMHRVSTANLTTLNKEGTNGYRVGIRLNNAYVPQNADERLNVFCNIGTPSAEALNSASWQPGQCLLYPVAGYVIFMFIVPPEYTDSAEAKAWLEAQGCEVVYRLAAPEIFQVELAAVSTRKGLNRFSCENGSIRLEYTADTKLYIDGAVQALREILENA